ncbi:MAG: M23 family metallopeptidase [Bryobacteraceae bacterium]
MRQEYFVVVVAHSLRGRLRRIHVPHQAVYAILGLALLGCFSAFGFVASYARMAWKVANYNALRREADTLRTRYQNLQKVVNQTDQQLASLEIYAQEVSIAYGIKQKLAGPSDISGEGKLTPSFAESVEEYNFLRSANAMELHSDRTRWIQPANARPSIWPVAGRLTGAFGGRMDPFSGEGAFHTGVDISAPPGTPVRATADGVVMGASWEGGYGLMIEVDHGGGVSTYYAHLSRSFVQTGQAVRLGQIVGSVGATGRTTAPHLHYEVRIAGAPVNPYRYHLAKSGLFQQAARNDFVF